MKLTPKNIKEIAEDWDNVRDAVFEYQNTLHEDELNDNEIREHLNKTKMWKDEKLWLYNEREFLDYLV
jgi:hypothetical protein